MASRFSNFNLFGEEAERNLKRFYKHDEKYCATPHFIELCEQCRELDIKWVTLTDFIPFESQKDNPIYRQFVEEFEPLCERKIENRSWYLHGYEKAVVWVFPFSQEFFDKLKKYSVSLMMDDCKLAGWTMIPQDICMFREDGSIFLGTVSHEGYCDLFLTEEEEKTFELPWCFEAETDGPIPRVIEVTTVRTVVE